MTFREQVVQGALRSIKNADNDSETERQLNQCYRRGRDEAIGKLKLSINEFITLKSL